MKKIILLIFFTLIVSCGFKPMFSNSKTNFSINEVTFNDSNGKVIYNNLKRFIKKIDKEFNYNLIIKTQENKIITLKDKKGDASNFRLTIKADLSVIENEKLKFEKTFQESFDYNNSSKKFDLSKYENEIKNSMLNKISDEIILSLYTLQ